MTDTEKFQLAVQRKGLKYSFLADSLHISRAALWMKIRNETEFKVSEMVILSRLLGLNTREQNEIFFTL